MLTDPEPAFSKPIEIACAEALDAMPTTLRAASIDANKPFLKCIVSLR